MADMLVQRDSWIFAIYRTRKIVMVLGGLNVAYLILSLNFSNSTSSPFWKPLRIQYGEHETFLLFIDMIVFY